MVLTYPKTHKMYLKRFNQYSLVSFSSSFIFLVAFLALLAFTSCNEVDKQALLELRANIDQDPTGVFNSWNDTNHFCQWPGVTCGKRHQRVTVLDLKAFKLSGSISPHIGNLSFLRELILQNNSFSGEIPPQIGRLRRLQKLSLQNNLISGLIPPTLSNCTNLVSITLHSNKLEGTIPMSLGSLLQVKTLSIANNSLTGSIPPSLGNLSSLQVLLTYQNKLSGNLPSSLCQLKNLTIFSMSQNQFSGFFPPCIFNLSSLLQLDIGLNNIQGSLPPDLGYSLPNVQFFSITTNQFTGTIPVSIANFSNLQVLQLSQNSLTGKVPSLENLRKLRRFTIALNQLGSGEDGDLIFLSSLTNATGLEYVGINFNNLGGKLPEQISNFSQSLSGMNLNDNQIYGPIPKTIDNLKNLMRLDLSNNKLSGTIPSSFGRLQSLDKLYLAGNNLSGSIPSSLGNLTNLTLLGLWQNNLQGTIPSSLANCQKLLALDLSINNLSGPIPPEVIGLSSLSIILQLAYNQFTGVLPVEAGNLVNLGLLDVSNNKLSGEIPSTLGSCARLEFLHLQGNLFQGSIPSTLDSLRGLIVLDLSYNNLSGKIPEFLGELSSLKVLNLSYNNFEGMVPVNGAFKNASGTSVMGNSKICGGILEFHLPRCSFNKKPRLPLKIKIIISAASLLLAVSLVLTSFFLYRSRRKRRESSSTNFDYGNAILKVSYQTLLKATNEFSESNLIGAGSFGSVYKGTLEAQDHQETVVIAVKVLNLARRGAFKSFAVECEALKNIRHRNLVKVLTACSGIDYHGNDFKALVYEFMVNGNLDQWLHQHPKSTSAPKYLNLSQRLNIAIDVACALEYLHHQCEVPIVHCDLKPSNVLLDHEMTGHVGDFGLAKFLSKSATQSSSIGIRGTIGYTPPEYSTGSEVSAQGDVYSYGIFVLEMFTGKRPTDDMFRDNLNIHYFVKNGLPGGVMEVTDPILLGSLSDDTMAVQNVHFDSMTSSSMVECLTSIFEIGTSCSSELPCERMKIGDVVSRLSSIRSKLAGTPPRPEKQVFR